MYIVYLAVPRIFHLCNVSSSHLPYTPRSHTRRRPAAPIPAFHCCFQTDTPHKRAICRGKKSSLDDRNSLCASRCGTLYMSPTVVLVFFFLCDSYLRESCDWSTQAVPSSSTIFASSNLFFFSRFTCSALMDNVQRFKSNSDRRSDMR